MQGGVDVQTFFRKYPAFISIEPKNNINFMSIFHSYE
jgi:hypothetical protein